MKRKTIVILPGWLLGPSRFESLAKLLKQRKFEVFTVHFPGFEGIPLTQNYSLTDYVKFTDKFLRSNKIAQAIFICHSFGGRVALKLLSQQPQKGMGLILSGTPGYRPTSPRIVLARILTPLGKALIVLPPFIFFRKPLTRALYRIAGSMDYYNTDGYVKATFKSVVKEQLVDYMKKIRIPTLLIWGEKDKLVPVEIARRMQKTIQNSSLVTIPDTGHNVSFKNPDLFLQKIEEFINSL